LGGVEVVVDKSQNKIANVVDSLKEFLLEKNKRYGDIALNPAHVFSKETASNSIKIRMDDKLNRIRNSDILRKNDVVDLAGYLVLLMVAEDWIDFKEFLD
jgi:hypothetical protein